MLRHCEGVEEMTENKKRINVMSRVIDHLKFENWPEDDRSLLIEIKGILEKEHIHEQNIINYGTDNPEQQSQPDEELVKKFVDVSLDFAGYIGDGDCDRKVDLLKKEIRSLLQSRKPRITNKEMAQIVATGRIRSYQGNLETMEEWLKSKGFDVREK